MPNFSEYVESDYNELEDREPFRTRIQRKGVGIIEMEYYEDDQMVAFCPRCQEYGFRVKLVPRILMPGEERQPDYESWLSCPSCSEIVAAYIVEGDASIIRDEIPTIESPFENTTEIIGVSPRRNTPRGRRTTAKRRINRPIHPDNDIQRELDKHGSDNVHIIQG